MTESSLFRYNLFQNYFYMIFLDLNWKHILKFEIRINGKNKGR